MSLLDTSFELKARSSTASHQTWADCPLCRVCSTTFNLSNRRQLRSICRSSGLQTVSAALLRSKKARHTSCCLSSARCICIALPIPAHQPRHATCCATAARAVLLMMRCSVRYLCRLLVPLLASPGNCTTAFSLRAGSMPPGAILAGHVKEALCAGSPGPPSYS